MIIYFIISDDLVRELPHFNASPKPDGSRDLEGMQPEVRRNFDSTIIVRRKILDHCCCP